MKKSILWPIFAILLAAALLFGLSIGMNGIAKANAEKEHMKLLQTLLPDSKTFYIEPHDGADEIIQSVHKGETGFVIETRTAGYAGDITMMIAVSTEGKVVGLRVMNMSETYGLGWTALTDADFLGQFLNTSGDAEVGTNVDAVSGATVTSKAIARSVNAAVAYVTGADVGSSATG